MVSRLIEGVSVAKSKITPLCNTFAEFYASWSKVEGSSFTCFALGAQWVGLWCHIMAMVLPKLHEAEHV